MTWLVDLITTLLRLIDKMGDDPRKPELLAWLSEGKRLAEEGHNLNDVVAVTRIAAHRVKQIHEETDALARAKFSAFPRKD